MVSILVSLLLSWSTKNGWLINNINVFLTVLETEISVLSCQHDWVLVSLFLVFTSANFSLYPHVAKRGLDCSFTSSYKGTNPIHEPLTLLNKLPSKVPTSKYYNIEIRILTWILQEMGTKHSVHCCWSLHDFIIFILLLLTFSCDLIKCVLL